MQLNKTPCSVWTRLAHTHTMHSSRLGLLDRLVFVCELSLCDAVLGQFLV